MWPVVTTVDGGSGMPISATAAIPKATPMMSSASGRRRSATSAAASGGPMMVATTYPFESTALTRSHSGSGTRIGKSDSQPDMAEDRGERGDHGDEDQQRPRKQIQQREAADQEQRGQRHDVVQRHEPDAPVPIQEGARQRADEQPREDAGRR